MCATTSAWMTAVRLRELIPHTEDSVLCEYAKIMRMIVVSFIFVPASNCNYYVINPSFFSAPGFCPAQNASFFGTSFLWQMTPAGTNATFTCPDNTRFSVTRECFSCNRAGIWLEYNERGCGSLTGDLSRILNQSVSYYNIEFNWNTSIFVLGSFYSNFSHRCNTRPSSSDNRFSQQSC